MADDVVVDPAHAGATWPSLDLGTAINRVEDGFVALDREWRVRFVNAAAGRLLDREVADLLGKQIWAEFPDAVDSIFDRRYREALETQEPVSFEARVGSGDTWFSIQVYPSVDGVTLVFRDVTSLRALTAERLDLPARLLEAEDRERARIAADVHEDSVQAIGVVSLHLQLLSAHLHQPSVKVESLLAELNTYVTSATERLRSLLFSLEPTDANTPIARSIRIQAAYVFEGSTIHWSVDDLDGGEELPQAARSQALRITKEALSNVRAHSKASEVIVTLTGDDESLEVLIADNGETIDPAAFTSAPGHRGLATMQDRAIAVGGWCVIEPSEPHGCSVRFHLPRLGPTAH